MKNSNGNEIWGVILIIVGIVLGLNSFDLIDVSLFFRGWWTLFIIVPALVSMLRNGLKASNTTILVIGLMFFLAERDLLRWGIVSGLIWPVILVGIGFAALFSSNSFSRNHISSADMSKIRENTKDGIQNYNVVFSGQEVKFPNEKFKGATVNAIFGGVDLDLRNAIIDEDVIIDVSAVFGGVDILVSSDVVVKVNCVPIFGGVDNKSNCVLAEGKPVIYLNGTCVFGGIEIK